MEIELTAAEEFQTYHVVEKSLEDGFVDYGRVSGNREAILIKEFDDHELASLLKYTIGRVQEFSDLRARILAISLIVTTRLGGIHRTSISEHLKIGRLSEADIRSVSERTPCSNGASSVLLGDISFGVCRHRALLLKLLIDRCCPGVPCRLVRGEYRRPRPAGPPHHTWNAIRLPTDPSSDGGGGADGWLVLDTMHDPLALIAEGTDEWARYTGPRGWADPVLPTRTSRPRPCSC